MIDQPKELTAENLIGGVWMPPLTGEYAARENPAKPGSIVGRVARSTRADVDAAVAAASEGFRLWSRQRPLERAEILLRAASIVDDRAEEIAELIVAEMGKPIREALPEVHRCSAILKYFAGDAWRDEGSIYPQAAGPGRILTRRRPRGVFGLITPWNFPVAIPVWKLVPALAYGNTVVVKLSEAAAISGTSMLRAINDAGLPPGVLNCVTGTGSSVGNALIESNSVYGISFTGSVPVGRMIRDAATPLGKAVQLELGGQNPLIVMADAKMNRAVEGAYAGAFWSAGQKCTSTRRIYVQRPAYDQFRELFLQRVAAGVVGDPTRPDVEVGPLVNERQWEAVSGRVQRAVDDGCTRISGGEPTPSGCFVQPTVFEHVPRDHFLLTEEVFGPVTSLLVFDELEEAIALANDTEFGLAAGIYTQSIESATVFCERAEVGVAHVNSPTPGAELHVPFGGTKASGWGPHEQGTAARDFYTETVTIYEDI